MDHGFLASCRFEWGAQAHGRKSLSATSAIVRGLSKTGTCRLPTRYAMKSFSRNLFAFYQTFSVLRLLMEQLRVVATRSIAVARS